MNDLCFGVSVGISRVENFDSQQVYIHVANLGSVSVDTTTARHIGLQLIMTAEFLETRVNGDDT